MPPEVNAVSDKPRFSVQTIKFTGDNLNMIGVIYIIKKTVYYLVRVILIMMFARALSSWIINDEDSKLNTFLYSVTEPFVIPVRMLVDKVESLRNLPMDISFMLTFMILGFVQVLLSFSNI